MRWHRSLVWRVWAVIRTLLTAAVVLSGGFLMGLGAVSLTSRLGMPETASASLEEPTTQNEQSKPQPSHDLTPAVSNAFSSTWDEAASPNYYRVLGVAEVGDEPDPGATWYGELDELGRATGVVATVTYDSMMAGRERAREDVGDIEPSGWGHNQEVDIAMPDGTVYHGLLYNRSHLLAKSLGGDEEIRNLMTGTRTQNVGANVNGSEGGMAYTEGLARSWLEAHQDGTLYYAVTPVYEANELVARSVLVDVCSSDGSLDQRVEVYNAARGFAIDYATGEFSVTEDAQAAAAQIRARLGDTSDAPDVATNVGEGNPSDVERPVPTGTSEATDGERKVIVTGSGKAYHHDESCKGLENARSMEWVTLSEAESMGRHPCGICGG